MSGRQPYRQLELHEKYGRQYCSFLESPTIKTNIKLSEGPVVRVAPNELSFSTSSSWRDIYGPRKGIAPFVKSKFYDGGNFAAESLSIVSERDPAKHAEMRRYLNSAFSDRSLKSQESLIADPVDRLVDKLGYTGQDPKGTNIVMWFNLVTFDIIGSLAFGKDFGGVEEGKEHFWVSIVAKSLRLGALADCFRRFPFLSSIAQKVFSGLVDRMMVESRTHQKYTMDLVQKYVFCPRDPWRECTNQIPDVWPPIPIERTSLPRSSKHAKMLISPSLRSPPTLLILCTLQAGSRILAPY